MSGSRILRAVLLGVLGVAVLAPIGDAQASLRICNKTDKPVTYHHSYYSKECGDQNCYPWRKEGWWNMAPGECKVVFGASVKNRYFYYYAQSTDAQYLWTSDTWRWVVKSTVHNVCMDENFSAPECGLGCTTGGHGPCYPFYNHRQFQATSTDYTLNLT